MIELEIIQYLEKHLSVPVSAEKPDPLSNSYVLLEKTSSRESNQLASSTFAFQSYAESLYKALVLNDEVKKVVKNLIELDIIAGVSLTSDYNFTDITTKEYRYQAVFEIAHY